MLSLIWVFPQIRMINVTFRTRELVVATCKGLGFKVNQTKAAGFSPFFTLWLDKGPDSPLFRKGAGKCYFTNGSRKKGTFFNGSYIKAFKPPRA